MPTIFFIVGLVLLFSALGFDTSIPDVAARLKVAFTPAASWRFVRATIAAGLIVAALASSVTAPHGREIPPAVSDAKAVYKAVASFQRAHGLIPDGVVGPKTCPLLYKVCPVK